MKQLLILTFLFAMQEIIAQELPPVQSVAVFKNGTGFFIRSGEVKTKENKITFDKLPKALAGTFGVFVPGNKVLNIKTLENKVIKKDECLNFEDLLKQNVGKKVSLMTKDKTYTGEILVAQPNQVMIKTTDSKWVAIRYNEISTLEFVSEPKTQKDCETIATQMDINLEKNVASQQTSLFYLERGISWVPSYYIELLPNNKLKLSLQALLVNESTDLINSKIQLVVGIPNFKFANQVSSIVSKANINAMMSQFGNQKMQVQSQSYANYQNLSNNAMNNEFDSFDFSGSGYEQTNLEDLFFYEVNNFSLPKDGSSQFEILSEEFTYEDLYNVDLPVNGTYGTQAKDKKPNEVWHSIKFANSTSKPLTTGIGMIYRKNDLNYEPVSQDQLNYTPPGAKSYLKMTVASDIAVQHNDKETARVQDIKLKNYYYDKLTIEGEIRIKNFKNKNFKLNIQRIINGELLNTNSPWKFEKKLDLYSTVNAMNDISWEVDLKAGEEKTITYSYTVLVDRR